MGNRGMRVPLTRAHLQISCADARSASAVLDILVRRGLEGGANREGVVLMVEANLDDVVGILVRESPHDIGRRIVIVARHPYECTVVIEQPLPVPRVRTLKGNALW